MRDMRDVREVFVIVLQNFHLPCCMRPAVEEYFAALCIEWKILDFHVAFSVQSYFGYPCDDAVVGDPRIEIFEFF